MSDVEEQQRDDDPVEEISQKRQRCACSKWVWVGLAVVVAVLVIVPLTVTSIQKENEAKAKAAVDLAPAWSPAMAPAFAGDDSSAAPQMLAPAMAGGATITQVPTIAPTVQPLTCGSDTQLVCPADTNSTNSTDWIQVANDIVGEASGDLSGFQISMSCDGSIVAVGAGQNDGNGDRAGHVRVYRLATTANSTTEWQQMGADLDGEKELDWFGYSVSLAANGLRIAIGARYNDNVNGDNAGKVRVYDYDDLTGWTQVGQDILGEAGGDESGRAVSMNAQGTRVAIGASGNDASGLDAGQVRVYELDGTTWTQVGVDIDGEDEGDRFGRAVALSSDGNKVVVGAYTNNATGEDAGQTRVYELISGNWTQIGEDIDGSAPGDWAGLAVDISGDGNRIVVGAPGNNDRSFPGVSLVYEFIDGAWTKLGSDLNGGYSVSLSEDGSRVAVGDYKGSNGGTNAGQVNVYEYDDSSMTWVLLGTEISGDQGELSGTSVFLSADGDRVAVSSPVYGDAIRGDEVGATRVYDLCSP
jgi:hypothetical protein